jgi:phenol 2-monooxygenase (NADPH)
MEGEQTDYVWGVVDMIPDTDFPDIRNRSVIHSNHGSCMVIPREGDLVRLYIQLEGKEVLDAAGRRVDKNKMEPLTLLEVRVDVLTQTASQT